MSRGCGKRKGKQEITRETTKREGRNLTECAFEGLFASVMISTHNGHDKKTCSEVYHDSSLDSS